MNRIRFLTAGESHGRWLAGIIEGIPAGLELRKEDIQQQLQRRKLGFGRGARQKLEPDAVEIASGVRHGKTLGSPISLLIENRDWTNWKAVMAVEPSTAGNEDPRKIEIPRPGHADFVGAVKYGHNDLRNVLERASARETTMRVALGTVARRFLETLSIHIASRVIRIGSVEDTQPPSLGIEHWNAVADASPARCLDSTASADMVAEIETARAAGDTLGGIIEVVATGLPVGLGSYTHWDRRIEGPVAQAFMSLNAIKGVEIGEGFRLAGIRGSQAHDELFPGQRTWDVRYQTNRAGGITGGMTTGQPLLVRAAMKPIATLMNPLHSVNPQTNEPALGHIERSDICAVPATAVIGESLLALVIANALLEKFGGDSMGEILSRFRA